MVDSAKGAVSDAVKSAKEKASAAMDAAKEKTAEMKAQCSAGKGLLRQVSVSLLERVSVPRKGWHCARMSGKS